MLDTMLRETVTLRRAKAGSRSVQNEVVYEILRDAAEIPIEVRCRIERRRRRIFSTAGVEEESDGTMLYRISSKVDIQTNDLVVDRNGQAYKILGFDEQSSLFGSASYRRADLRLTRLPVQEDGA
jgi:hypothetical protein